MSKNYFTFFLFDQIRKFNRKQSQKSMSFYLNSLKKGLENESEISERSHDDSFFQKDFEKLKGMLSHLKEVPFIFNHFSKNLKKEQSQK